MAAITRTGFGQVEGNHLSAQRTGQIYAQLPADDAITQLENGQFVKYDYAEGKVNFAGAGEWMLVNNEVKLYDGWRETYKDFAMLKTNYVDGEMVPRVFKTNVGDIYTTNCLKLAGAKNTTVTMEEYAAGDLLVVNANGFLEKDNTATTGMIWEVADVTTLPDGTSDAVKIMRIQ